MLKQGLLGIVVGIFVGAVLFGAFYVAKHCSYNLWYKDMVKKTIIETVKPEALKAEE